MNSSKEVTIGDKSSPLTNCTYSYLYRMYRLTRADGTHLLSTYSALPKWAKTMWRLNRLDLARAKRDSGLFSDIERVEDIWKPKARNGLKQRIPARIKWLQSLDASVDGGYFERAANVILAG